jgi:hypothetical protein
MSYEFSDASFYCCDNDIFEDNFFTIEFPIQFKFFDSLKLPELEQ